MTGSKFCFCPHCGSDLRGDTYRAGPHPSTHLCRHGCGSLDHYSRLEGVIPPGAGRTTAWQCPDCGKRWDR